MNSTPLKGVRILSLALNLPGPAALMRLSALGARCTKVESPAGDPMAQYSQAAYAALHQGVRLVQADLKTAAGMKKLHALLAKTDVLLTSFRPAALARLGLEWKTLHAQFPKVNMVSVVGDTHAPDVPGHDLTYLAEQGLVNGTQLPTTLFADMGGSLLAVEAVISCVLAQQRTGKSSHQRVGLLQAAQYLALPLHWGLTTPRGVVGGGHALYQVYACKNGRVAVAALEPHFAKRLCELAGLPDTVNLQSIYCKKKFAAYFAAHTRKSLDTLAQTHDLPLHTLTAHSPHSHVR